MIINSSTSLSIHYAYNQAGDIISLDQTSYINKMVEEHGFENMKPAKTPMAEGFTVGESYVPAKIDPELQVKYWRLLGSLLFLSMWTRLEVT